MIKLYDSAFSPFARKVRMALEYKGLDYEAVDGLLKSNHQALKAVMGASKCRPWWMAMLS